MAKRVAKTKGRTSSGTTRKTTGATTKRTTGTGMTRGAASGGRGGRATSSRTGGDTRAASKARRQSIRKVRRSSGGDGGGAAHPLVDREEIRQWAQERGAVPTCVVGTGGSGTGRRGGTGMIRLEFPQFGEEPKLQPISWDRWFETFDENGLALLVQDETGRGEKSNFNKLVKRSTVESKAKPKVRGAH